MGKFVVKKTNTGIKFDLKADNGQVIATGESYKAKARCMNGIESVKKNVPSADIVQEEYPIIMGFHIMETHFYMPLILA